MRYQVLRPKSPTDPRHLKLESTEHLNEVCPMIVEASIEDEAVEAVRAMYPDAIAMPVPFKLGSGEGFLLGILESIATRPSGDSDVHADPIPFVLLVRATADDAVDRRTLRDRQQFSRQLWQAPVIDPTDNISRHTVELRASNLPNPVRTKAVCGEHNGRLTIRCVVDGVALSITFESPDAEITAQGYSTRHRKP